MLEEHGYHHIVKHVSAKEKSKIPTYEYSCIECDEDTEVTRGFHDPEVIPCCSNGHEMKKVWNAPGNQFKGSGFYKTDNG